MKVLLIGSGGRESAIIISLITSQAKMLYAFKKFANRAGAIKTNEQIKLCIQRLEKFTNQEQFLQYRKQYQQNYAEFFNNCSTNIIASYLNPNFIIDDLYCTPANPQIASLCNVVDIKTDNESIKQFCKEHAIDLVIIGPEDPLANGLTDELEQNGIQVFGPSKLASQIESSKIFMKNFCTEFKIPTAKYATFYKDKNSEQDIINFAKSIITDTTNKIVLKTNGLAAGKGVVICEGIEDFELHLKTYFDGKFGNASQSIVVEEFMEGREVSFFALCDGVNFKTIGYACDHKKLLDNNQGPNTGGMGTYSHKHILKPQQIKEVENNIINPLVIGMRVKGHPYKGVIFAGLMITNNGIKLIEYNARFGDPETQAILPLLQNNIMELALGAVNGIKNISIELEDAACVNVVCVSGGYPDDYKKGIEIKIQHSAFENAIIKSSEQQQRGLKDLFKILKAIFNKGNYLPQIIHCGISSSNNTLVTNGGRVISVRAKCVNITNARTKVYNAIRSIKFDGMFYRKDI